MNNSVMNTNSANQKINRLDYATWDAKVTECVLALQSVEGGSDQGRLEGLKKVIGKMYPMYGMGVIKNLADRAMKHYGYIRDIRKNFSSVWFDHDTWNDRRLALIKILGLIEGIGIFNDVFFSQKDALEVEMRGKILEVAYGLVGANLGYWKHLSVNEKKKEIKEKTRDVLHHFGKGRIEGSYRVVVDLVEAAFDKRLAEYTEKEKGRLAREKQAAKEHETALKAEMERKKAERLIDKQIKEAEAQCKFVEKKIRKEERKREVAAASNVMLSNGKKAKVLPTVDHVIHLPVSQYAVVDGTIYQRTGNGVKKDEFVSVQKETQSVSLSPVTAVTGTQELLKNLEEVWVNKSGQTVKVYVVPWLFSKSSEMFAEIISRGYQYIAVRVADQYIVYAVKGIDFVEIGNNFRKATDAQKRIAKTQSASSSTSTKKPGKDPIISVSKKHVGSFGEALMAAGVTA